MECNASNCIINETKELSLVGSKISDSTIVRTFSDSNMVIKMEDSTITNCDVTSKIEDIACFSKDKWKKKWLGPWLD